MPAAVLGIKVCADPPDLQINWPFGTVENTTGGVLKLTVLIRCWKQHVVRASSVALTRVPMSFETPPTVRAASVQISPCRRRWSGCLRRGGLLRRAGGRSVPVVLVVSLHRLDDL